MSFGGDVTAAVTAFLAACLGLCGRLWVGIYALGDEDDELVHEGVVFGGADGGVGEQQADGLAIGRVDGVALGSG